MEDAGGINGEIVAVTDSLAQVQSTDEQTAVTWTDDTAITLTSDGTLADVTVGVCVSAVVTDDVATSVTVTQPDDDGSCTTGFGSMGGMSGGRGGMSDGQDSGQQDSQSGSEDSTDA